MKSSKPKYFCEIYDDELDNWTPFTNPMTLKEAKAEKADYFPGRVRIRIQKEVGEEVAAQERGAK